MRGSDPDAGEMISSADVRARKSYVCDDCLGTIHARELYTKATMVFDGSFYTWRTCECCASWVQALPAELSIGYTGRGWLKELLEEDYADGEGGYSTLSRA